MMRDRDDAHKVLRSQSKMQRSLAHYSRTSHHSPPHAITGCSPPPPHKERLPRAMATQESSRLNQEIFHLPDGTVQRARRHDVRHYGGSATNGVYGVLSAPGKMAFLTNSRKTSCGEAMVTVESFARGCAVAEGGAFAGGAVAGGSDDCDVMAAATALMLTVSDHNCNVTGANINTM